MNSRLAKAWDKTPHFSVSIENLAGEIVKCSDPQFNRGLIALMDFHAVIGGAASHWGGPSAFAEIISAVHSFMFGSETEQIPWFENYNFVNDAGHCENGIYALRANYEIGNLHFNDLKQFRSIKSKLTGHGEVLENPEHVLISNGPLGSGIAMAQGLAMADKHKNNNRVTICTISDGALMEGEAKEALTAIPGLADKNLLNPFVCILSDNGKKLSGIIEKDSYSLTPYINSLTELGWKVLHVHHGHNLQDVYQQIEKAINHVKMDPTIPMFVWVDTIKGYGIEETTNSESGGHGFPLKANKQELLHFMQELYSKKIPTLLLDWMQEIHIPIIQAKASTNISQEKIQVGVEKAMIQAKNEGIPIISISSDLASSTGVKGFQKVFPHESFDLGVAESNMISAAVGFSKLGYIPVVDTFAQFGVAKGLLPIIMSNLSQAPIIAIFSHTGLQDAADGASHQATQYLSALSSLPNTIVINLSCSDEAHSLIYQGINYQHQAKAANKVPKSIIYFLGRENFPSNYLNLAKASTDHFPWNTSQLIKKCVPEEKASPFLLICSGSMMSLGVEIWEELAQKNQAPYLLNRPFINTDNLELLIDLLKKSSHRIVVLEDHQRNGGLASRLCFELHDHKIHQFELKSFGINDIFGTSAYSASELYERCGLSKQKILDSLQTW